MKKIRYLLFFIFCFVNTGNAVTISPASFCLEKFDIGMNTDLGIDLILSNVSNLGPIDLNVRKPKKSRIIKGYEPIPNANWLYFLNPQIVPGKDGRAKARMFFKVPNEQQYLNQHWVVQVAASPPKIGLFSMDLVGIYMIETRASDKIRVPPYGPLGVVPSRLHLTPMVSGKQTGQFFIYNNEKKLHTFNISVKTYQPSIYSKLQISQAPGFEWIKDVKWITLSASKISINGNSKREMQVKVNIPKGHQYKGEGWEAIIMVESIQNSGLAGFLRLLLSDIK
jgi:hypothetical protein